MVINEIIQNDEKKLKVDEINRVLSKNYACPVCHTGVKAYVLKELIAVAEQSGYNGSSSINLKDLTKKEWLEKLNIPYIQENIFEYFEDVYKETIPPDYNI